MDNISEYNLITKNEQTTQTTTHPPAVTTITPRITRSKSVGRTRSQTRMVKTRLGMMEIGEFTFLASTLTPHTPSNISEINDYPKIHEKKKWNDAMETEIKQMNSKNVWTLINNNEIPANKNPIGMKWV